MTNDDFTPVLLSELPTCDICEHSYTEATSDEIFYKAIEGKLDRDGIPVGCLIFCSKCLELETAVMCNVAGIESFIDREIEAMDESGQWSTHAIDALLQLQARIDGKLKELISNDR